VLDLTTGGLGLWVRSERRHGWRSLLGLSLLVALGRGITLAALGGARRTDSAFDRFLDRVSSPVDVSAAGNEFDLDAMNGAWGDLSEPIAGITGVRGVTPVSWMGVARALGFTPRQAASSVRWQGIVITAVAIVAGVPLGVVVGRLVWKQVAAGVGAVDLVSIPWPVIVVAPAVALATMLTVASVVGRRAALLQPAAVLRSE
jgi:hypothetical protein